MIMFAGHVDVDPEYDPEIDYEHGCPHCNDGVQLICPDSLCRGSGGCMKYSDTSCYRTCPHCGGSGE